MPVNDLMAEYLKQAARMQREALVDRDQAIMTAHAAGGTLREIGELVGLSHVGVLKIIARGKDGRDASSDA